MQEISKKGNSKARKEERENFVCKNTVRIRSLVNDYKSTESEWRKKVRLFVELEVRPEIEYNYTTGWWDIFKFIQRTYEGLFDKKIFSETPLRENLENDWINEAKIKIEDEYCSTFGCGRKLSLQEKRFGNRCINHPISQITEVEYR